MIIFNKEYDDESTYDLSRDVAEALDPDYNSIIAAIPQDENGFKLGVFIVSIEWKE